MSARTHSGVSLPGDLAVPDRYRIVRRIAAGGMATVWRAQDVVLGREVAIKLLGEQFSHDERAVRRLEREARAAARLSSHPHVVTIYDVGQSEPVDDFALGRPFIVMEYLPAGTVADALRVGAVERDDVLRWLGQAAAALDYAHARGVIHRDIKPANFLLDRERRLHVGDFGIARVCTEETITGTGQLFGTAAYLSPEQALGRRATDASDRYALAVVAYELLVGERPFVAEHFALQASQHIDQEPPCASQRNPTLPGALDPVLTRGMAKRAEDRWATAGAFADALEVAFEDRPQTAPPRSVEPLRPRGRAAVRRTTQRSLPQSALLQPEVALGRSQPALLARRATPRPRRATPRPRAVALAALAAAAFGLGAAIGAVNSGTHAPRRTLAQSERPKTQRPGAPRRTGNHVHRAPARARPAAAGTASVGAAPTTAPATTAGAAGNPTRRPSADSLETRGHTEMLAGNYPAAIDVLRQAVAAAAPGSLTNAYALYDLGRSLRLAGDPRAAAVILQRRLQIPNQTGVVRRELELALRALGAQAQGAGGATPGAAGGSGGQPQQQ